jgi:hypothetical protein
MTTKMRIYSSLALTAAALFVFPLSSDEAAARGGLGGGGGIRSFGVVRTSPVVISRSRTTNVSAVRKQTVTQTKLKNFQVGDKLRNKQVVDKVKNAKLKNAKLSPHAAPCISPQVALAGPCRPNGGGGTTGGGTTGGGTTGGGTTGGGTTGSGTTGGGTTGGGTTGGGTTGGGTTGGGTTGGGTTGGGTTGGGTTGGGTTTGGTDHKPPVIVHERRPVYLPAPVTVVAPAAVAVDPPGCVYERSVRKLPGGGLQRVIVKICPDA